MTRRAFLASVGLATFACAARSQPLAALAPTGGSLRAADLPVGTAPPPLDLPHFPDPLHAFIWRNWQLVPVTRMARAVNARPDEIRGLARAMGLPRQPRITADQLRRSALTIIKRNWHLLPYDQLLELLGWTAEEMAFTLREDDFLYVKLGNLKPKAAPLRFEPPTQPVRERCRELSRIVAEEFPDRRVLAGDSLFSFVRELSRQPGGEKPVPKSGASRFSPSYGYSYFELYGDPLLDPSLDNYPEGYLARLAESGVDGVWLQGLLSRLAPFPWDETRSAQHEVRLRNLGALVEKARRRGIGVYLYLNEPRALPLAFFERYPELKGVVEGDYATLCTSHPDVQKYLRNSAARIGRAVPGLAGIFTITASENLTHCWSHYQGAQCPRCRGRGPGEVIGESNRLLLEGLQEAGSPTRLIAWDWGWQDAWAPDAIRALPAAAALMSVSEWSLPISRGGVESTVGEYSISAIGPGPRARRHWQIARERGLKTLAKIQAGCTWELSAVPYIPAVENVARHAANLRSENIEGLMLGWTLGGYPSPNLEVVTEIGRDPRCTPEQAMMVVARGRFGDLPAPHVVQAWLGFSAAFREFPFGTGLYNGPLQLGPANLLWGRPTGYAATMVGFPYDDLDGWRGNYPAQVFHDQLEKVANGFEESVARLADARRSMRPGRAESEALRLELSVAEAAAIHFRSAALQCRFVVLRRELEKAGPSESGELKGKLRHVLEREIQLAKRLHALQVRDGRLGFEASNQYYYVPLDLVEKVLNCRWLMRQFQE